MYSVLQAGHWKSLKTSITIGAFLEPAATCGSTSVTGAEDWPALTPSAETSTTMRKRASPSAGTLTLRKRSTQSSPVTYNPKYITPNQTKILPVIGYEMKLWPPPMCQAAASAVLDKMRIGPQGRLESAAQTGWKAAGLRSLGWDVAGRLWKDRRAVLLLPGPGRGLRPALQERGRTARNGCPTGAQRYRGEWTARNGCPTWSVRGRRREEGKILKALRLQITSTNL